MDARELAHRGDSRKWFPAPVHFAILGTLLLLSLAATPPARAQAAGEYAGATSVSAGTVTSQPRIFSPVGNSRPNSSVFLAKPVGPPQQQLNREWFAKQAGKDGARLTIAAVPAQSSVWIDGKFVGQAPLTVTLPAGKHHLSLSGTRQEHADQDVEIAAGKDRHLEIHLQETYPRAVSITAFGNKSH